ncbi:MAG: M48 family metallopeptidase [Mycoplasmoidaceae bacterium]|nr:M48 family metallopeptidase [Mycoplasmoidaceae bacterium]
MGNKFDVEYLGNNINVYLRHKRDYLYAVKHFYKQFATTYLAVRTSELINQLGLKGQFSKVSWATYYYGRCDGKNIEYSAKLMQYSKQFIDSVIYHEIAHFTHMNHKKPFWDLLKTYCPNYYQLDMEAIKFKINNHIW